ncbi:MAG: hypothetical protein MUF07_16950 [Steroidobacteraceae bacterium]|jgi:hypothetical protein|nr:hypothetical protein [Steroidobacteraceae bacterium]
MINYPIVRLYATSQAAKAAVANLKRWGFEDELINVVDASSSPPANAPASAASSDPVLSAILCGFVLKAHAEVYAREVRAGRTLVSLRAPFGVGGIAEELLDEAGPVPSAVKTSEVLPTWDDAAPFSSALGLPTTVRATAPFSTFWVLPTLTRRGRTLGSALGFPEISSSRFIFGSPSLSRSAAPLSSMLKLPLLSGR